MSLLITGQLIANSLRLDAPPPALTGEVDWARLVHHADGHSLTPLLYATWHEAGQLERIPAAVRERMAQAYADNARRNENIRAELLELDQLLSEAAVPHLILKGWSLIENLYSDPARRVLYDHDFLVPAGQAETGHRALQAAGFRPLPGKDEWIEKHLPALWRNDNYQWNGYLFDPLYPRPVELHVRLWEQGWRGLAVRQLPDPWADAQTQIIAGAPMQRLSAENTLIHLAMHFAGHLVEREARLNQLLDLARFVQVSSGFSRSDFRGVRHAHVPNGAARGRAVSSKLDLLRLEWDTILQRAAQAGVSRFVYASLFLAHEVFGSPLPPPPVWQQLAAATPPAFRAWLAEHGPADVLTSDFRRRHKGQDYRLTFLAASSNLEKLGILRFAALPPLGQLAAKYKLRHRWLGPLLYPRYVAERVGSYGRGLLRVKHE
ncbi:MAG: nucleotidyltransferase family protein [Anaerolineae bacterium]|nr:nucleotidyltransferase family protein [Anaerolineae bacterium]